MPKGSGKVRSKKYRRKDRKEGKLQDHFGKIMSEVIKTTGSCTSLNQLKNCGMALYDPVISAPKHYTLD